ncbi:hypothetical protein [Streptomyces sp. NPDC086989]|uniref:hypothetical protein n=1 Tax=Streptomyces sp. NPDC086989 TaxID=3365764 RepID=UPI0038112AA7
MERGLGLDCDQCRLHSFIPLQSSGGRAVCPACSAPALYQRENNKKAVEVVYRLNAFIDRAVDNGVLPHLLVIAALQDIDPSTYLLPGVDVYVGDDDRKQEVDVFGVHEGRVLAGEVKVKAAEFSKHDQIARDVELSRRLGADIHLMAATDMIDDALQDEARERCERAGLELLVLHAPSSAPASRNSARSRADERGQPALPDSARETPRRPQHPVRERQAPTATACEHSTSRLPDAGSVRAGGGQFPESKGRVEWRDPLILE